MDKLTALDIVKHPLATEKAIKLIESENKLIFIVDKKVNKKEIKEALEALYNAKIVKVNTLVTLEAKKKVYVKLHKDTPAMDIATELGLM